MNFRMYVSRISVVLILAASALFTLSASAQSSKPAVYVDAQPSFQTALTAALIKKDVPVTVVTAKDKADLILQAANVASHQETGGSKIARCLFADCIGIEGSSAVSVQLIQVKDGAVVWAYQVRKANGGPAGIQSLSEAIAKHLKNDYLKKAAK